MHCSPCLKEFKNFNKLVDKYKNKVNFLSFTSDEISEVDSLLKIHPFLFDIVPDARRITKDDFKSFWTYPFTIIVDEENRITHVLKGYKSSDSDDEQFVALDSLIKANL